MDGTRAGSSPTDGRGEVLRSIDELKQFVRFDAADVRRLVAIGPAVAPHLGRIARDFYDRLREHAEVHAVLGDEGRITRLISSLERWLERLFCGVYDHAYFAETERVGRIHVQIGLPQRWMAPSMSFLRSALGAVIATAGRPETTATIDALGRLLDLELDVMLETYRDDLVTRVERASGAALGDDRAGVEHHLDALELAPLLVVGLGPDGKVVLLNREAERATGYARDEVLGRSFEELFLPDGWGDSEPALLRTRAGAVRHARWTLFRHDRRDPAVTFAFGVDVTEERKLQDHREQEKRLVALGTLAAGLAHEIRNPLNGAQLHLAYLERALLGASTDAVEAIQVVGDQLRRLARLVTDFLEYAQARPAARDRTTLLSICKRACRAVEGGAEAAGVALRADLPDKDVALTGDAPRLEKAIVNLLQNAIDAVSAARGEVVLSARREPARVWIAVEDDGPGLPAGEPPVFDPFYTTKAHGTGLGLSIVHRIVTDHGGNVEVDSRPGSTRFRIQLPLQRSEVDR